MKTKLNTTRKEKHTNVKHGPTGKTIQKTKEILSKMPLRHCESIICNLAVYEPKKRVTNAGEKGYRRCSNCEVYLKYQGIFCPCCSNRMKVSPNNNKSRKKVSEKRFINGIDSI